MRAIPRRRRRVILIINRMKPVRRSEWIAAIIIIGCVLFILFIITREGQIFTSAKQNRVREDLKAIDAATKAYFSKHGNLPAELALLLEGDRPMCSISDTPLDPWGNEYQYCIVTNKKGFIVWSWGADGHAGGEGEAADLVQLTELK